MPHVPGARSVATDFPGKLEAFVLIRCGRVIYQTR